MNEITRINKQTNTKPHIHTHTHNTTQHNTTQHNTTPTNHTTQHNTQRSFPSLSNKPCNHFQFPMYSLFQQLYILIKLCGMARWLI